MNWNKTGAALVCFGFTLGGGLVTFSHLHYRLNLTDSLPRGIYRETTDLIHYGSLVAECLPPRWAEFGKERGYLSTGSCPDGTMPILKQVVGMAGDIIELSDESVVISGVVLPCSATQKEDSQGRPVPAIPRGTYVIKTGEVFLLATNIPNSWDSRYTGPARLEDIITTARAVWTEAKK